MRSWSAPNLTTDESGDRQDQPARASWYAQGASDGLGDRLLMFDNSGGPSLELLRFSWRVVAFPGFEDALRERVELLSQFRHPAFTKVRAVEKLEPKNDLTLVSNYAPGKRLSDDLAALRGPAFAMWVIRELVPALVSFQQLGRGVAHGALTADRIVLTPEGRLVMVEHVLGSALEHLQLSREEMWARFGIAAAPPTNDKVALDCQSDIFQLGMVALSVLLGRSIASYEYPHRLGEPLGRFQQAAGRELPSSLRSWLTRALHIEGKPFESARDAQNGLGELDPAHANVALPGAGVPPAAPRVPRMIDRSEPAFRPVTEIVPGHSTHLEENYPEEIYPAEPTPEDTNSPAVPVARTMRTTLDTGEPPEMPVMEGRGGWARTDVPRNNARTGRRFDDAWQREIVAADLLNERRLELAQRYPRARLGLGAWALASLGILALVQTGYIGYLLYSPTPAMVIQAPLPVALSVAARNAGESGSLPVVGARPASPAPPEKPADAITIAPAAVRAGGVRLISQIELQLLDGDRVLGSNTDGAIVTNAGRHEFEVVNSALGYRSRQVVNIKPGEILSMPIGRPDGRLSINAVPWADVWIDRVHIGETPLANLSIPIGEHEVSFRHPAFGEQRRTTIVRFDVPTRLSADLR